MTTTTTPLLSANRCHGLRSEEVPAGVILDFDKMATSAAWRCWRYQHGIDEKPRVLPVRDGIATTNMTCVISRRPPSGILTPSRNPPLMMACTRHRWSNTCPFRRARRGRRFAYSTKPNTQRQSACPSFVIQSFVVRPVRRRLVAKLLADPAEPDRENGKNGWLVHCASA